MWTGPLEGVPESLVDESVSVKGKVYSFDAYHPGRPISVYILDPEFCRWDVVQTQPLDGGMPSRLGGHSVVTYGDRVYLWGGLNDGEPDNAVYCLDTNTMTWSRPEASGEIPTTAFGHSACMVGNRMYIFGGIERDHWQHVWFLQIDTMIWHRIAIAGEAAPEPRFYHTACAIGTRMYVWGGQVHGNNHCDNSVGYLETTTSTWVRPHVEGIPPTGRISHSAFVYRGEMYIFGGYNPFQNTHFADIHKYDPQNLCWTLVTPRGSGPCARRLHGCCIISHRVFVFNGVRRRTTTRETNRSPVTAYDEEFVTDMHVLDLALTLKSLCLQALIDARMDVGRLPPRIMKEISCMVPDFHSSKPS